MKKDHAALFVLFSILIYVPLAEAGAKGCEKISSGYSAGNAKYSVYCDGEQQTFDGRDWTTEDAAEKFMAKKQYEDFQYELARDARLENAQAKEAGKPMPYPEAEPESEPPFDIY